MSIDAFNYLFNELFIYLISNFITFYFVYFNINVISNCISYLRICLTYLTFMAKHRSSIGCFMVVGQLGL